MISLFSKKLFSFSSAVLVFFLITSPSWSCTRLLHLDKNQGVIVGRNMDWFQDMATNLFVYPRGIQRNGGDPANSLKWVSRYGSIAALYHDAGTTDGMNEKGFAAHMLWLADTDYGNRIKSIPGLSLLMWAQFYLDNFQTVAEAVHYTESNSFQLTPFIDPFTNMEVKVHLAIEDSAGDSAIIEYKNGLPVIYHSPLYTVLTNDPTYDVQLKNMHEYQGLGGDKPISGTNSPADRFVRAAFYEKKLPEAATIENDIQGMVSVLANVSHPDEYFLGTPAVISTIWRTVADLTHHVYYFNSTANFTMNYSKLDEFNLNPGASIMKLDMVHDPVLAGDVTFKFNAVKNSG